MKENLDKKRKILVLSPAPYGVCPSQRLKYEQYFDYLEDNGFITEISSFYTINAWKIIHRQGCVLQKIFWVLLGYLRRTFDLFRLPFYDGLYVHLWVTPLGFPIFESLVRVLNVNIVYDIDDMIFLKETNKFNKIWSIFKGRNKPFVLMKKAKYVIVCTPRLKEIAMKYNKNVSDISSTINTTIYQPVSAYRKNKTTTLGWTGSFSGLEYLHVLDDVLKEVSRLRKIKLLVISNLIEDGFVLEGIEVEGIIWNREFEVSNLQRIEIGLYPLLKDEWCLGKSGLKALQYMALGIPVVATSFGANLRVIEDKNSGFLVNNKKEWIETIVSLIDDLQLRKKIGSNARSRVEKYFSVEANKDKYLRIFDLVYKKERRLS